MHPSSSAYEPKFIGCFMRVRMPMNPDSSNRISHYATDTFWSMRMGRGMLRTVSFQLYVLFLFNLSFQYAKRKQDTLAVSKSKDVRFADIILLFRISNEIPANNLVVHPFQTVCIGFLHRLNSFVETHFFIAVKCDTEVGGVALYRHRGPHGEVELVKIVAHRSCTLLLNVASLNKSGYHM